MKKETQIMNWLKAGVSQSPNSMNESFYFDRTEKEFFSILVTDYFMLDEGGEIAKNTTTSYSETNQNKLVENIKRIEKQDSTLISIPRLSNKERQDLLSEFIETIDDQSEKIRLKETHLNGKRTIFDLKFEIEASSQYVDLWNRFKDEILLSKVDSFLNLNNINIEQTDIWIPSDKGSITIDLTKDDDGIPLEQKPKWWEFWK